MKTALYPLVGNVCKYEAAEQLHPRDLEGREKMLEKDHPDTLTSVDNLRYRLKDVRSYEVAEKLYRRERRCWEKSIQARWSGHYIRYPSAASS
jgi:hypothetical protein